MGLQPTNPAALVSTGVAPSVPNILSYSRVNGNASSSPFTLATFPANGRLWQASLSLACATDGSTYVSGLERIFAQVNLGSGEVLAVCELAISGQNQTVSDHCDTQFWGLAINRGDTLILNTNGGGTFTGATITASAIVLVSFP